MATVYYADGHIQHVAPTHGSEFTLEELQAIVGGYIELVQLKDGRSMFCNEEGKLQDPPLPFNDNADDLAHRLSYITPQDYIVGDVIVCDEGETS